MSRYTLWLSPAILDWDAYGDTWEGCERVPVRRAYEHLRHADELLRSSSTDFDFIDVVATLKRAVDHRLRLLNAYYKWKTIPVPGLPEGQLQLLETLGVARHRMVDRLLRVRNAIEHGDKPPPSREGCEDLAETVWYFLRSTDALVQQILTAVSLDMPAKPSPYLGVTISARASSGWRIEIRTALPPTYFATAPHDDWLRLNVEWGVVGQSLIPNRPSLAEEQIVENIRTGNDVLCINGVADGPNDILRRVLAIFFSSH